MPRIPDEQRRRNELCRNCWQLYAPHRERVTDLLVQGTSASRRTLCVLGAGNCNDLDLPRLLAEFHRVHLVDIDGESLAAGVAAQPVAEPDRLVLHGGVDLSGISGLLSAWSPEQPPPAEEIRQLVELAGAAQPLSLDEPADVVASVCLLSQLLDAVILSFGEGPPGWLELIFAVRLRHLRLLLELTRPGGRAILITDFVSSTTYPELATTDESHLPALATRLIRERNFFTGLNPFVLQALFQQDPWLAARAGLVRLSAPWRWLFPTRTYAVCAIEVARREGTARDGTRP
jgi:hypothetical protein